MTPRAGPREDNVEQESVRRTWIAIELVDQDGEPVGGARYRVEVPNGAAREGTLDSKGYARIEGIEPGTCEVSFPRYDDWKLA